MADEGLTCDDAPHGVFLPELADRLVLRVVFALSGNGRIRLINAT
jgi:hypothetical protein